ncbi:MAG: Crp/Fnr family transcriptional regulator [Owenweeksia sp.]|nr:Crp/Fnr family transcriptional regulator [Owenweeksia sp.]
MAWKELNEIHQNRKEKVYRKKEVIFSEGDYANYLYFIKKGKVKSVKMDEYGKEFVVEILGAKDFMGYMALFEEGDYQETAIVMEDVEVALIPKSDFNDLITKNRDVAHCFIKMLADNVHEKEKRLLQLAYTPVRERVANVLLDLSQQLREEEQKDGWLKISREDMANIVGTAKESLIRILSDFKKAGYIEAQEPACAWLIKQG